MTMQPPGPDAPRRPGAHTGLEYPTTEMPTYYKVSGYPEPNPEATGPTGYAPTGSTGQLPVTGAPVATSASFSPGGPHLPVVVRGVLILVMAAFVIVWRLVDHPDWAVVGIGAALASGALFLVAAAISMVINRARREHDFDRMLSG